MVGFYKGYNFYIDGMQLPYAPPKLEITVGSNNSTVSLIDGNELSILKSPKLTGIKFDIELPGGRQYPFAREYVAPQIYLEHFEKIMLDKRPVDLVIIRKNPYLTNPYFGSSFATKDPILLSQFFTTNLTVSLEGYKITESAENAHDITVSLEFKEYISYGTVKKTVSNSNNSNNSNNSGNSSSNNNNKTNVQTPTKTVTEPKYHVVKKGDTLWGISRKYYGTGTKWKSIYEVNKSIIEKTAKKYGKSSSSNGHWIYPGTKLTIPVTVK